MGRKLVYILPEYDENAGTHFSHTINFLAKLSQKIDLHIIVERTKAKKIMIGKATTCHIKSKNVFFRFIEWLLCLFNLRRKGFKKFYSHYSYWGVFTSWIITRVFGGKVYYWNCGLPHLFKRSFFEEVALRNSLCSWNDFLVTGTLTMAKYYNEQYNVPLEKILVIPNDIDLSVWQEYKKEREENTVLFVHRLSPRKGADKIPEIARLIWKQIPNTTFWIVGSGSEDKTIQNFGIESGHRNQILVRFGSLPNIKVKELLQKATLLFVPSQEEGMSRTIMEAQAIGTPFVATDVGGIEDYIPNEQLKYITEYGDVKGMAKNIISLLNDEKERERIAQANLHEIKSFDTQKIIEQYKYETHIDART